MRKKLLTICLCIFLSADLLSLTGCVSDAPQEVQTETESGQANAGLITGPDLVHQIIYSVLPNSTYPGTELLLNELKLHDLSEAMTWKQILAYWEETNKPGFVGLPGQPLPDGLPDDDSLVIEVLGLGLLKDGSMREELVHRLETALSCTQQYPNAYVLVTGGGTAAEAPEATEADAMADWFIAHGLSEDRLIIENRSKTTCENAVFSYEILRADYPQITEVAIVTSDYHITLGCMLFQAWFLLQAEGSTPAVSVTAHACCLSGAYTFTLEEQAYWLENLTTYR